MVAWLEKLDEGGRLGVQQAADANTGSPSFEKRATLFSADAEEIAPRWVEINASAVHVEDCRQFGGPRLAIELFRRLNLDEFLTRVMPIGREAIPWSLISLVIAIR